jgi:nitrate reductase NapD
MREVRFSLSQPFHNHNTVITTTKGSTEEYEEQSSMNIYSLIVHTIPTQGPQVSKRLKQFQGVQVHGGLKDDKLVITMEDKDGSKSFVSDTMNALRDVDGIVSTILIYRYVGDESEEGVNP